MWESLHTIQKENQYFISRGVKLAIVIRHAAVEELGVTEGQTANYSDC